LLTALWLLKKRSKISKRPTKEMRKESAVTMNSNGTVNGEGDVPSPLTLWSGNKAQLNRYES
ncbi:unnamed protein product, partial [Allacma fusca]